MSRTKKVASVAFVGAAAVAATGATAGPAFAAPSDWTVTPDGPYTAVNVTPAILNANGISLTCPVGTATASGSLVSTATGVPAQIGTIATAEFGTADSPCSLFGFGTVATLKKATQLSGSSFTDPVTQGRVGNGTTSAISASINGVGGFQCHMEIRGATLPGSYDNGAGVLNVNSGHAPNLTIASIPNPATSCLGLFSAGMPAWFAAEYEVSTHPTVTHEQ
jgi:hypothetical protein